MTASVDFAQVLGLVAACLTTFTFVPQVWQTLRTGNTDGISLGMYSMFVSGVACWLAYGWLRQDWPVVGANALTLVLASIVLALKVRSLWAKSRSLAAR